MKIVLLRLGDVVIVVVVIRFVVVLASSVVRSCPLGMFVGRLRGWLVKECINSVCRYTQVIAQQCQLRNVRQPKPVGSKRKYYKAAKIKQKTGAD